MNPDLITRLEEHVIALQDVDVRMGTTAHAETIKLLREAKALAVDSDACCQICNRMFDTCSNCED